MITVYWDEKRNIFSDEFGWVIYNIFKYITPNQLLIWRKKGGCAEMLPAKNNKILEIVVV